jgi:multidrug efflux pump subunit AcrA (membrane-fusion protein)
MHILEVMPEPPPFAIEPTDASWSQLERMVQRLHEAARGELSPANFYRQLLSEACDASGAVGGTAWRRRSADALELLAEIRPGIQSVGDAQHAQPSLSKRRETVQRAINERRAILASRDSGAEEFEETEQLVCPIADSADSGRAARFVGAIELCFPIGADAALQQGRRELLATLAEIASDFHSLAELRELRATAGVCQQAVDLLRRIQRPRDLNGTAFAVANEVRRVLACDRVALVMREGVQWRLLSASGVSRADRQSEFARLSERLAEKVANWGEPIAHVADRDDEELPPGLAEALAEHLDHSHARQLAAVPLALSAADADGNEQEGAEPRADVAAVLLAECFDAASAEDWQRQLVEVGELAAPALARAATLDRFPIRTALRWSDRWATLHRSWQRKRTWAILAAVVAGAAGLAFIPAELTVEAPATLAAAVEREVFATATGSVAEIHASQGQVVKQGDVLIVLRDAELTFKLQQVRGELDATRQRLEALAFTRTDRTLRERPADDRLPLSAEQRQLEERLATLELQLQLLSERHDALTLRSPINGEVLTPDVENLLASRPVERGQSLLTIADVASGWELHAEVSQRDVGAIIAAQVAAAASDPPSVVPARFRLSGDVAATYDAHVAAVSAAVPLEADGLEDAASPVNVRLAVSGAAPAAARPGMAASVRIECGEKSLGYVWFHDVAATLYRWATF